MREIEEIGDVEKRYEVLDMFGDGGQGDLFLGRDRSSGQKVALKLQKARDLGPESAFRSAGMRLVKEGSHMMMLSGIQAIPEIIAVGTHRRRRCLIMEFIEGRQLHNVLREARPVKHPGIIASVIGQLCEILAEVHDQNLVHCDLKPENVIVQPDGRLRLIDMGLAVVAGEETDWSRGTRGWASPEQSDACPSGLTRQADIFGLGCILLEMTVMRLPYGGLEELAEAGTPVLPADKLAELPPEFASLALWMVRYEAAERPANVREVFDRLRPYLPRLGSRRPPKRLRPDPTEYYRTHSPRL
ncbi:MULTISPECIES: serine/threonine protein kinase [Streptomyces]|uniref:serine/threonine protein kinase n=1 Tax=Streptomyces TaxID=1883 RepID=UPI0029B58E61|nr:MULTISPECIES: serine/threonine-protein kinase [Streptomyces]MDX3086720.1 serine/threonine-protein kinase [Streptomyces sp. ME12-02E]MDX3330104.1 serine/threonine-protein kinase [Streptomyces sp. ME02-6978a]